MSQASLLLVDDDSSLLKLLSIRLKSEGYEVRTALSGKEALQLIEQQRPDLVMSDLRMDEMDGLALFDQIQKRWLGLPVIIMTAHGTISDAVSATRSGVFSFLAKPIDKNELAQALEEALAQSASEQYEGLDKAFVTRCPAMIRTIEQASRIALSDINVLITGDSGTGKTRMAQTLHAQSQRREAVFIEIDCRLEAEKLEIELFGDGQGFASVFERADGGILFLDEVAAMPLALQGKLVESLNEYCVNAMGDVREGELDVRIFSASQQDLVESMDEGTFREDLYYRLNVANISLPSLRERLEDIPVLAKDILKSYASEKTTLVRSFSSEALACLATASWPGNIRQLHNVLEQAISLTTSSVVAVATIRQLLPETESAFPTLVEARNTFERDYLIRVLKLSGGNARLAAELAGRNRTDFYKLLRRHEVEPAQYKG